MKPHAHFAPINGYPSAEQQKLNRKDESKNDIKYASSFCFPTIESLLSKENSTNTNKHTSKISPYEIRDNQFIFDNQSFSRSRFVRTATISPRSSKSPPARHVTKDISGIGQNCNFNSEKKSYLGDSSFYSVVSQKDLGRYQGNYDNSDRGTSGISTAKADRRMNIGKRRQTRHVSPPVRHYRKMNETFACDDCQMFVKPHKTTESGEQ